MKKFNYTSEEVQEQFNEGKIPNHIRKMSSINRYKKLLSMMDAKKTDILFGERRSDIKEKLELLENRKNKREIRS